MLHSMMNATLLTCLMNATLLTCLMNATLCTCVMNAKYFGATAGRLRPLPTDTVQQRALCELIDMGAFYLAEFASKQCCPIEGSAVHGGLHVLQVVIPSQMGRLLHFPRLSQICKVPL